MQIDRKQAQQMLGYINELEAYAMAESEDLQLKAQILAAFPDLA